MFATTIVPALPAAARTIAPGTASTEQATDVALPTNGSGATPAPRSKRKRSRKRKTAAAAAEADTQPQPKPDSGGEARRQEKNEEKEKQRRRLTSCTSSGQYLDASTNSCTPCPLGTYREWPLSGSHTDPACKLCPAGMYSDTTGSSECKSCDSGGSGGYYTGAGGEKPVFNTAGDASSGIQPSDPNWYGVRWVDTGNRLTTPAGETGGRIAVELGTKWVANWTGVPSLPFMEPWLYGAEVSGWAGHMAFMQPSAYPRWSQMWGGDGSYIEAGGPYGDAAPPAGSPGAGAGSAPVDLSGAAMSMASMTSARVKVLKAFGGIGLTPGTGAGAQFCRACPAGKYNPARRYWTGGSSGEMSSGNWLTSAVSECTPCPAGTFYGSTGASTVTSCMACDSSGEGGKFLFKRDDPVACTSSSWGACAGTGAGVPVDATHNPDGRVVQFDHPAINIMQYATVNSPTTATSPYGGSSAPMGETLIQALQKLTYTVCKWEADEAAAGRSVSYAYAEHVASH